jgi:paraquat-inducible protein A
LALAAIGRTGQTHAPMAEPRPLAFRLGAVGYEACGLVSVPAGHDAHCPRCGSALHAGKSNSLKRTWAFVIAGAILYVPANKYPVLSVIQAGAGAPSTILGGVEELLASQMYPLVLLVFFASILVPAFKLIGFALMLVATMLSSTEAGAGVLLSSARDSTMLSSGSIVGRWSTSSWNRCWAHWCSSAPSRRSSAASAPSPSAPLSC